MMTDVNRRIAAMINAILEVHDQAHEVTGPCVLEMHDGGEVVRRIEVHRDKEGDWGEASISDDDGTPIRIDLASPIFWKFSDSGDLLQLCHGLGLQLIVWDTCKYPVHPWETDENVSVVTITPGDQGPPIYLDHPVAEVQAALDIILTGTPEEQYPGEAGAGWNHKGSAYDREFPSSGRAPRQPRRFPLAAWPDLPGMSFPDPRPPRHPIPSQN